MERVAGWMNKLFDALGALWQLWRRVWVHLICDFYNLRRRIFRGRMAEFPVITLDGPITERVASVPWFYAYLPNFSVPMSLQFLNKALRRMAEDPDLKGVIFLVKSPQLSLAQAQSIALKFGRFRTWDRAANPGAMPKRIIVHMEQAGAATFMLAAAADEIYMTPLSDWGVAGLRSEGVFLKESLARIGVEMDVVKIAPWKTAMDRFANSEMSEADRAQRTRLLDGWYEDMVAAIAAGRKLTPEAVRGLIDRAPLFADDALAAGLIDGICYEDELAATVGKETGRPAWEAKLLPYKEARRYFYHRPVVRNAKAIGVIGLHGMILPGESRSFPVPLPIFGEETMGSSSVQQMARAALDNDRLAAVVVHVDSGGGSALASDIIWRELDTLAGKLPVVVYMGDVAASGGYFIATPGRKIVAQRATLTGSIGVITGKPVTAGAYAHLGANREAVQRGANAGLYSDAQPWSDSERAQVEHDIRHVYDLFKRRVADGRGLDFDGLDAIANGQVWTGAQAQAIGLVDEIGDFQTAMLMACDMAGLPMNYSVPIVPIKAPGGLLAQPFKQAKETFMGLSALTSAVLRGEISELFGRERIWFIADGLPKIK